MSRRDTLISWLSDAYALEKMVEDNLESHIKDARALPNVRMKFEEHLAQTRRHQQMVKLCLDHLGSSPSTLKTTLGKMSTFFSNMGAKASGDSLVKDALMDVAAEHFEIASYKSIIAAARLLDEQFIVDTCSDILRDEEAMAAWIEAQVPTVTQDYLSREAA